MTTTKPRLRMIIPIWGADYIERWLALSFASLRADGNIPELNRRFDFELALVTKAADAVSMRADPRFNRLMDGLRVVFIAMDEFFPAQGEIDYGVPLTLAYGKAILDLGDAGIGSFIIIMTADMMLSDGSFRSLADRIGAGYTIVTAPSIRVVDGEVRPLLLARADAGAGVMSISPREMMAIVNAHLHNTVRARTVNEAEFVDSTYYHNIYWRVSPDCLAAHYFLMMPLCFQVQRLMRKVVCPIDYGFITEICPDGHFSVLADSDELVMLELQERDSQSYLLRIAPPASDMEARLTRLEREIAVTTGGWATAEQRRSASVPIYFHEHALPPDIAERTARFEKFMASIFEAMPPAVPHAKHFHWLGQVRNFRSHLARGGSSAEVALLDDPRNDVTAEAVHADASWTGGPLRRARRYALEVAMLRTSRLRGWGRLAAARWAATVRRPGRRSITGWIAQFERRATDRRRRERLRRELSELLRAEAAPGIGGFTVACFEGIDNHLPPLPDSRPIRIPKPTSGDLRLPAAVFDGTRSSGVLVVFLPLERFVSWTAAAEDVTRASAHYRRIVIVLVQPSYNVIRMWDASWLLSVLLGVFADFKGGIRIEAFPRQATRDSTELVLRMLFPSFWLRLHHTLGRLVGAWLRSGLSYPLSQAESGPDRFSALLVHITGAGAAPELAA